MGHTPQTRRTAYLRYRQRRIDWFKENGPCRKCSSWENLELDHIDPSTKESHLIWSWSDERRLIELAKCQPLCHKCHKLKTTEYLRLIFKKPFEARKHGTTNNYWHGPCRCDLCKAAFRVWRHDSYKRNKVAKM